MVVPIDSSFTDPRVALLFISLLPVQFIGTMGLPFPLLMAYPVRFFGTNCHLFPLLFSIKLLYRRPRVTNNSRMQFICQFISSKDISYSILRLNIWVIYAGLSPKLGDESNVAIDFCVFTKMK